MSKLKKALERAKKARGDNISPLGHEGQDQTRHPKPSPTGPDKPIQEIKVNYSRTKVLNIDPRKLKENKIPELQQAVERYLKKINSGN